MKKKFHKNHKKKMKGGRNGRRNNAGGGGAAAPPAPRPRPRVRRGEAPPWKTIGAAVAGSVGSAIASGLAVSQKIAEPETISLLMAATGGVGAYLTDGNTRVAFTGVAAAGAGQYALVKLGKAALAKAERDDKERAEREAQAAAARPAPAQLPPGEQPPAPPLRQRANARGVVVDLFRDTTAELEELEDDERRYATRDADIGDDDDEPIEIDLDEAA